VIRTCTGCSNLFETMDLRKKRCTKNCGRTDQHAARGRRRESHLLTFTGIDGEGVTRPSGEHLYDMLSVGNNTLTSPDGGQLHWRAIYQFLWENFLENPTDTYAGFFLGYDFTQWFRTLPEDRASMLLSSAGRALRKRRAPGTEHLGPFPVRADGWEFDILGTKRFKLRWNPEQVKNVPWMYINDTGPFFQQSFLAVVDPKGWNEPVCTPEEYATIVEGKADRGRPMDLDDQLLHRAATARYNTLENDVLARVLARLNQGFTTAGVQLNRRQWYGPGQAAQTWLNRIEAPTAETVQDCTPGWALDAARKTYFGGWFEIFAHGHVPGTSHEYDINSAYPHIIAQLPCLLHGSWDRDHPDTWTRPLIMARATVSGSHPYVGAMLHREKDGRVLRPNKTTGWYWWHEIEAAENAGIVDSYKIHETISYSGCDCTPPLRAEMEWLYQERLKAGKNTPAGKAMKLVYNSAYGKFAQSVGMPKYGNAIYASLITSGTRTMILDAIGSHPSGLQDLLMVATDGVYFASEHPQLDPDPARLGAWDHQTKHNLTLFMPGVYWDDTTRQRLADGASPKLKSRGVSARDLAQCIGELDQQFTSWRPGDDWPAISIPVAFAMTTATQALARGKWNTAGHVQTDGHKTISSDPHSKRAPVIDLRNGAWWSYCYPHGIGPESVPYDQTFGAGPEQAAQDLPISPDERHTDDAWKTMLTD
jgi:hypothetical protein